MKAVILFLLMVGFAVSTAGCGSHTPAQPVPPSTNTATPATTTAPIRAWWLGGAQQHFDSISGALGPIRQAGTSADLPALGDACRTMITIVRAARTYSTAPDVRVQKAWAQLLTDVMVGANDCAAGADGTDLPLATRGAQEMSTVQQAADRLSTAINSA